MRVSEEAQSALVEHNNVSAFRAQVQENDIEVVRRITEATTDFFSSAEIVVAVKLIEAP